MDDIVAAVGTLHWRFAKTMPQNPHEYVQRTPENEAVYAALFRSLQEKGALERFGGRRYRYWYPGDGYKYWAMTDVLSRSQVINRAKVKPDDAELPGGDRF